MHKYRARGRDLGVIVNQEGKVGHGLVAAVRGDLEIFRGFVGRSIDIVDANVVAICEGCYPGWITVCVHVGDDQGGFLCCREIRTFAADFGESRSGGLVADFGPCEGLRNACWSIQVED
jgi:hypothetical protein